jgi:hypothetical protein
MHNEIEIPKVPSFNYPVWSPDGKSIVVSGLVDGHNDLYQYDIETNKTKRLTNDSYSNVHPTWSPDGSTIAFITDKPSPQDIYTKRMPGYYIATLDLKTLKINTHHFFPGASNLNPVYTPDGKNIYFLSDRDGFRNLYLYNFETGRIFQKTKILTGISGMTELAPAFSAAITEGTIAYSYYFDGKYSIFTASPNDLINEEVFPMAVDFTAATLPPYNRAVTGIVDRNISKRMGQPITPEDSFKVVRYRPKFKLDYIANSGVGVSTGQMGTGMAGGVEMIFSDIVGANLLHVGLALNGEIYDFGGQFTYINQKNRVIWGASVSHIPYSFAQIGKSPGALVDEYTFVDTISYYQIRRFETMIGGMAQFPLSKSRRIEAGGYLNWYNYRVDVHNYQRVNEMYYTYYWREKGKAPDGFALQRLNMAYVVDNSSFGIASPMDGSRQRIQVDQVFGDINYTGGLVDLRKYIFIKPISLAFKGYYYGRFGKVNDLNDFYPLYLGYPWIMRGYDNNAFTKYTGPLLLYPEQLTGNQMATVNFEVRLPFTGPERLSRIKSKYFYTELALFADAGIAFNNFSDIKFQWTPPNIDPLSSTSLNQRIPVVSAGISVRVNVFGMLILEPYYAIPFQIGGGRYGVFGLNFTPGW